jgi:hypothetical protein
VAVTGDGFAIACYLLLNSPGSHPVAPDKTDAELEAVFDLCGDGDLAFAALTEAGRALILDWATRKGVTLPLSAATYQEALGAALGAYNSSIASAATTYANAVADAEGDL